MSIVFNKSNHINTPNIRVSPNPFNKNTSITYTLLEPAESVTLEVIDQLGRKVATLINAVPQQAGKHHIKYLNEDKNNPSGTYILRLTVDGKTSVARIVEFENE